MMVRILFGVGLFTLGYVIGKAVGSAQAPGVSPRLIWEGEDEDTLPPHRMRPDADFAEARRSETSRSELG
jgi:hypothetical protein